MQDVMFLVIITDLYLGTEGESTTVCRNNLIQYLQQCSLSSSIVTDDRYVLATVDFKTDILK